MKTLIRLAGSILSALLVSCGGGEDTQLKNSLNIQENGERKVAMSSICSTEVIVTGVGPGGETEATDAPLTYPPDLITPRMWLETTYGEEVYKYGYLERVMMKAQFKNIGDGPPTRTVPSVFILSKGYKVDAQSERKVVGSDETQPENLEPGETHTETESLDLVALQLAPGIWNIIACPNRTKDDDSSPGAYEEKHKSNNCSTEAVFEVTANPYENFPVINLTATGYRFLQAPVYAGDNARLGVSILHTGNAPLTSMFRGIYEVSCNGGPRIPLTDDETSPDELPPGGSAWEETLAPVRMPDTPGNCTAYFRVDAGQTIPESDETDNEASFPFTLLPRPMPNLIITYIEIDPWPDSSIQRGKEHHPTMKIKNVGSGPMTTGIRSAYYWYGPSTGNTWQRIADDGTDAGELCVGCEVTETIKAGFKATKTGIHYLRACADYLGNQPESNESDNCKTSGPITVK